MSEDCEKDVREEKPDLASANKKKRIAVLKKALTFCFYVLVVVFVFLYFKDIEWDVLLKVEFNWGMQLGSFLLRMAGLVILPPAWGVLLKSFGDRLSSKKLYSIYAQSWIGRYIPGKVAWLGGKIYFAVEEGVDKGTAIISSFLDSMLQVIASLLVAAIFFIIVGPLPNMDGNHVLLTYGITVALLICLIPAVFNRVVGLVHRVLKKKSIPTKYHMGGKDIVKSTAIVTVGKVLSGVAVSLLAVAVYPQLTFSEFIFVIAVNSSATAIGMVALFAPAGLGVKEGLQMVMLSAVLPREMVLVVITMASLQSIVVDVVFYLAARSVLGFKKASKALPDD